MDPLTLLLAFFSPNLERRVWTIVQAGWLAIRAENGIEPDADEREDTWPVTQRPLGVHEGVELSIGIRGHETTYLDARDPAPLDRLLCMVGGRPLASALRVRRFETGDDEFDGSALAWADDDDGARRLLGPDLRRAIRAMPAASRFQYDGGRIHLAWSARYVEPADLVRALEVVVAACRRPHAVPYR